MAEMMDGALLDLARSTPVPGVMEIIGGLGLFQSLEDAVEAAAAALEGDGGTVSRNESVWVDCEAAAGDSSTPKPGSCPGQDSPEPGSADAGLMEAASDPNPDAPEPQTGPLTETSEKPAKEPIKPAAQTPTEPLTDVPNDCPTESIVDVPNECPTERITDIPNECPTEPLADIRNLCPTEPITAVPNDCPTEPITDVPNECPTKPITDVPNDSPTEPLNSAKEPLTSAKPLAQTEPLSNVPNECPTESQTQPEKEPGTLEASAVDGEAMPSAERAEQVTASEAKAEPMPVGEERRLNAAAMESEPDEEAQSLSQEEIEEEEEEEQQVKSARGSRRSRRCGSRAGCKSAGRNRPANAGKRSTGRFNRSKYNTVSYRAIRKGNTRQRIDEFESMIHL